MPAGVSWPRYIIFAGAAMLSMMAGSETVHLYYKPMQDFDTYVDQERRKYRAALEQSNNK